MSDTNTISNSIPGPPEIIIGRYKITPTPDKFIENVLCQLHGKNSEEIFTICDDLEISTDNLPKNSINMFLYNPNAHVITWNSKDKYYDYYNWIVWFIENLFQPTGFTINGTIRWIGKSHPIDRGYTRITDNNIKTALSL
tara:strand:+ start:4709 stop:5128 length:420 start_codon:yes stop_codon:yes gene_type:complete